MKTWSLTKNRPVTASNRKPAPPLTLSLSFTIKKWNFTKSRLRSRHFYCYLNKDLKIHENQTPSQTSKIFSKLIIKTLTQHSCNISLLQLWTCLCLLGYFQKQQVVGILKKKPIYTSRNFQGNIRRRSSFILVCSVYSKNLKFYGKILIFRGSSSEMFSK